MIKAFSRKINVSYNEEVIDMTPQGYPTYAGYRGYVPNEGWMLFATEGEYLDYLKEAEES